jgi:hypothetical protein
MAVWEGPRVPLEVPDWALDQHTGRGRRIGRGLDHFFQEGARIENEPDDLPDLYREEGQAARRRPSTRREARERLDLDG